VLMEELLEYRRELLERYAATVQDWGAALRSVPPEQLHTPCTAAGWSFHQTLAHVRDVEAQALAPRIQCLTDEVAVHFPHFDDLAWMEQHYRPDEPAEAILAELAALRARELDCLVPLQPRGWNRAARHPWHGLRTLMWWVERSLYHSQKHLDEVTYKM
jgi:hypothetical protein